MSVAISIRLPSALRAFGRRASLQGHDRFRAGQGASRFAAATAHSSHRGVEPGLESAVMVALSKRPEQRFPSMRRLQRRDRCHRAAWRFDHDHPELYPPRPRPEPVHDMQKRAPLHTVALALARSGRRQSRASSRGFIRPCKAVRLAHSQWRSSARFCSYSTQESSPLPANPMPVSSASVKANHR